MSSENSSSVFVIIAKKEIAKHYICILVKSTCPKTGIETVKLVKTSLDLLSKISVIKQGSLAGTLAIH